MDEYDHLKSQYDAMRRNDALNGMCLQLTAGEFTRDDLIARGVTAEAADELVAFAERLQAKAAARRGPQHT